MIKSDCRTVDFILVFVSALYFLPLLNHSNFHEFCFPYFSPPLLYLFLLHMQIGTQTLLFFGSAMTNFGVELFLKTFLEYARKPAGRSARMQREGAPLLSSVASSIDSQGGEEEMSEKTGSASETGEGVGVIDIVGADEERTTIYPDR
jgi:hypothetical protein